MKYKSNISIIVSIVCIAIIGSVISFNYFKGNVKETSSYTENKEVESLIRDNTLTEIMKKVTTPEQKGPIPRSGKIAYITIDDGPSKYTNEILDILEKNNVKATFFMINGNMKLHKDEVERIQEEGHSAGFHSVSHDIKQLYKTPQNTLKEFETCGNTFYSITGKVSKLIRLPYGSKPYMPDASHELLKENGYKMWDWNLDTQDWRATTDIIVSNVLYYGRDNPNLVVLMHEKEQTVKALDSMIKVLKDRGYEILPITEDTQPRNYWDKNL